MRKFIAALILYLPFHAIAGDPIPGIDITVEQSPSGVSQSGTTNANGEVNFAGLVTGNYTLTLSDELGSVVLGSGRGDQIAIGGGGRSMTIKPIRLELSNYQDGEDLILRKRPGRSAAVSGGTERNATIGSAVAITSEPSRATDYNSSRSNKNATRSAGVSPVDGIDDDCNGVVDIVPSAHGSMKITVSCAD